MKTTFKVKCPVCGWEGKINENELSMCPKCFCDLMVKRQRLKMDRIVKARKAYYCALCGRCIFKGMKYQFTKTRHPLYSEDIMDNDVQVGIEYAQYRLCLRVDCDDYALREFPR